MEKNNGNKSGNPPLLAKENKIIVQNPTVLAELV